MEFRDEHGTVINTHLLEAAEQRLATRYVQPGAVVLELGARYGTVTCAISNKLLNKDNLVSVEPDSRVWDALEANLARNNCKSRIIKGFISKRNLSLTNLDCHYGGYGATFSDATDSSYTSYTLDSIQREFKLRFDTLIADCEGFLERFLDENPELYDQLNMIIFEADYPEKCNYAKIRGILTSKGFHVYQSGFQNVWWKTPKIKHRPRSLLHYLSRR